MKTTHWRWWACAVLLWGCGSEVVIDGQRAPDAPNAVNPTPTPACNDLPATLSLRNATSGSFVGDRLHLFAELEGTPRYVVIAFGEHGAWLEGDVDLGGPAALVPLASGLHARLVGDAASGARAEVIDTGDAASPSLRASVPLDGIIDDAYAGVYSSAGNTLLFCMRAGDSEERQLHALDLSDPDAPLLHGVSGGNPCDNGFNRDAAATRGTLWMSWGEQADAEVFVVTDDGALKVGDYYYVPDGIHAYGNVLHAASDGELVVFDPSSEVEFFLFALPPGGGASKFNHAYLGLGGPKQLLDVHAGRIYLATPDGVRAYALDALHMWSGEWAQVSLLDEASSIALGETLASTITKSDRLMIIADADGNVYAVPRALGGDVAPLAPYEREPCP